MGWFSLLIDSFWKYNLITPLRYPRLHRLLWLAQEVVLLLRMWLVFIFYFFLQSYVTSKPWFLQDCNDSHRTNQNSTTIFAHPDNRPESCPSDSARERRGWFVSWNHRNRLERLWLWGVLCSCNQDLLPIKPTKTHFLFVLCSVRGHLSLSVFLFHIFPRSVCKRTFLACIAIGRWHSRNRWIQPYITNPPKFRDHWHVHILSHFSGLDIYSSVWCCEDPYAKQSDDIRNLIPRTFGSRGCVTSECSFDNPITQPGISCVTTTCWSLPDYALSLCSFLSDRRTPSLFSRADTDNNKVDQHSKWYNRSFFIKFFFL